MAIKELKNGGVIRERLKVGRSIRSLYIILPGYIQITLILSTAVDYQPYFLFFMEAIFTVDAWVLRQ